jgi:alkylation response protein AidB-like acyl-CoA dehydrogenase
VQTQPTGPLGEYRQAAREWLRANVPPEQSAHSADGELATAKAFQAALYEAGYAGITWPEEVGGQGLGQAEQQAFADEALRFDLPVRPFVIGMGMCGPTLVDLGTPRQRKRYLVPMLRGDEIWCQLFSEPGAGSDVAGLQTRAARDTGGWQLTGQKVWTTNAQLADFGAVLARTDPSVPKHRGLTMFVLDMHAPGVTVRPLVDMTGGSTFNEVFLDGVHVGDDDVIGEVGGGWQAAVTMLGHERISIGGLRQRRSASVAAAALITRAQRFGTAKDPLVRDALVRLWADEQALALYNARLRQETAAGRAPGARGSVAKLAGALQLQRAADIAGLVAGNEAIAWEPDDESGADLASGILSAPASGIAGGTNEIQRGIIGERLLGLPKEPSADRGMPFRDVPVGTHLGGTHLGGTHPAGTHLVGNQREEAGHEPAAER